MNFDGKSRNVFFLSTDVEKEEMNCGYGKVNSLEKATKNYKQYEKLGLIMVENVLTEEQEKSLFSKLKGNKWENLSHR